MSCPTRHCSGRSPSSLRSGGGSPLNASIVRRTAIPERACLGSFLNCSLSCWHRFFFSSSPSCSLSSASSLSRIPFAVVAPRTRYLRPLASSSSGQLLGSSRAGSFRTRCFARFPSSRSSASSSRRWPLERRCMCTGRGGGEEARTQVCLRHSGVEPSSHSRWVWLVQCAPHVLDTGRRTSGFSGPALALLAPAAEPRRSTDRGRLNRRG